MGAAGNGVGAARPRHEHRSRTCWGFPGTNGTRAFESGWPTFDFAEGETSRPSGSNENFMPYYRHDPQSQYVVNFNWIKQQHNIRFGGDIYHMALNQAQAEFITGGFGAQGGFGFDRGITERCEAVDPATGNCEQTSDGSRYNSAAAFLIGQASRAGRTLQVPDEYHVRAWLYSVLHPRPLGRRQTSSRSTYGTRWEYFPVPTRPDRGIERYDVDDRTRCCSAVSAPSRRTAASRSSKTRFGPRVGVAYRFRRQVGGPRGIRPDQRSLRRHGADSGELPDPDPGEARIAQRPDAGAHAVAGDSRRSRRPPKATASSTSRATTRGPGIRRNWTADTSSRGTSPSSASCRGTSRARSAMSATRSTRQLGLLDINAGQVIGAGDEGKPLLRRSSAGPRRPCSCSRSGTGSTTRCRRSCSGGSRRASA